MSNETATQVSLREAPPAPVSFETLIATRREHDRLVEALIEKMRWRSPHVVQPGGWRAIVDLTDGEKWLLDNSGMNLARVEYAYRYWAQRKVFI